MLPLGRKIDDQLKKITLGIWNLSFKKNINNLQNYATFNK